MKFIQQAFTGNNKWWTYFITISVVTFPFLINVFIYLLFPELLDTLYQEMEQKEPSNLDFLINLLPFLFLLVLLFLFVNKLHKRKIKSIVTSRESVDWNRFFYAFFVWFTMGVLLIGVDYFMSPNDYVWNFKSIPFFVLLLISIVFLPIQTSMEELLFRGYLMQAFGFWFKKSFVALILTAVIFGLLHGLNPEVEKLGWIVMIYYIGTGLVLGIFTLMDEGTELALGFHAANNIVAAVLVSSNWAVFQTDALLIDVSEPSLDLLMFLPVFVLYPLVLFIFSNKYGWTNWKEKLFGTVTEPIELEEEL
ncbi:MULTISPECIES: CPBP family intramembrane glutamic endopeptidase [Flavobacteriaceae]|uniref:CPBP family intramembrane metalloprotease n=2 Tax=Flavobacteriaceae TaxID=49546 RepID=A0A4Y8ANU3_9FLAO|nr:MULTISPECIES: CPBP family intramembrane glutamic endopeptidase [Flavobacteriaceae]TEW72100.1 CPBP family intramembrane metalloprotease [Gramella jeungdoensis]GGK56384.1 abortive infection protein [Lutibacter litoralis]